MSVVLARLPVAPFLAVYSYLHSAGALQVLRGRGRSGATRLPGAAGRLPHPLDDLLHQVLDAVEGGEECADILVEVPIDTAGALAELASLLEDAGQLDPSTGLVPPADTAPCCALSKPRSRPPEAGCPRPQLKSASRGAWSDGFEPFRPLRSMVTNASRAANERLASRRSIRMPRCLWNAPAW